VNDLFPDVDGIVVAPVTCVECERTIYVKVERLRDELPIRCSSHG
jgi:hypothetical protein